MEVLVTGRALVPAVMAGKVSRGLRSEKADGPARFRHHIPGRHEGTGAASGVLGNLLVIRAARFLSDEEAQNCSDGRTSERCFFVIDHDGVLLVLTLDCDDESAKFEKIYGRAIQNPGPKSSRPIEFHFWKTASESTDDVSPSNLPVAGRERLR